jgi:hypothetical protein
MGIDTITYEKELLEHWFESVGEVFDPENVYQLFKGTFLPTFKGKVGEITLESPAYKTRDSDLEYKTKLDAYYREKKDKEDQRKTLLSASGYTHIICEGGGEGEGEYCYGVIKIDNTYLKAEWSYYSHEGCDYDYIINTLKVVTPKTKTITVYE